MSIHDIPSKTVNKARISGISVDVEARRCVFTLEKGSLESDVFVVNDGLRLVICDEDFETYLGASADAGKTIAENIEAAVSAYLLANDYIL